MSKPFLNDDDFTCNECNLQGVVYSSLQPRGRCHICGHDQQPEFYSIAGVALIDLDDDDITCDCQALECFNTPRCFMTHTEGVCDKCR